MSKSWKPLEENPFIDPEYKVALEKLDKGKKGGLMRMCKKEIVKSLYATYIKLLTIERDLTLALGDNDMALDPAIVDLLAKIDAATTAIANRIQKLIDSAANAGSLTSSEIAAALQPEVEKLTAMGSDPSAPV